MGKKVCRSERKKQGEIKIYLRKDGSSVVVEDVIEHGKVRSEAVLQQFKNIEDARKFAAFWADGRDVKEMPY